MTGSTNKGGDSAGTEARRLAIEAVRRIDEEGSYANLLLPSLLERSDLDQRDRNLVTELVYGSTRMRRALDWLVDRFVVSPPPPALRASLRVGAYQLAFTRVPPHAAVDATVGASAKRNRPPTNAILRKVAASLPIEAWPSEGIRLSYPDWLIDRLVDDHGRADALAMLERMNVAPQVVERDDGYVQDTASQWVVDEIGARSDELVLDLCAAPGGKSTALASTGATVVATDLHPARSGLVAANARRLGQPVQVATADGLASPFPPATFDRVVVDAPCSGLGVLRRRPDARWRVAPDDVAELASLQFSLMRRAASLVKSGGTLVYSVCTVTQAETTEVADGLTGPDLTPEPLETDRWRPWGSGGLVLPQDHDTDGMAVFKWRRA
ncbi:MAG: transcription antitermination factor NusB [Actinomycetota bacterium]